MKKYKYRIADGILRTKLEGKGAVLVEVAKWCGKTTTAEHIAQSAVYLSNPEHSIHFLQLANIHPRRLLEGKCPRLLDEWQLAPVLWDAVRFEVDHREDLGQFILTGSTVPPKVETLHHTGTGRIARMKMRPMSLFESGESNGSVSLRTLFAGDEEIVGESHVSLEEIAFLTCRGGWPLAVEMRPSIALDQAFDYCDAVAHSELSRARDSERVKRLMRSYARVQATQAAIPVIREDMRSNDSSTLDIDTVHSYICDLKQIFVIEDLPAWNPNLRSKAAIRTSDTRFFSDPSIATASLGLGPNDLMDDLPTFGLLFEALCIRDLRVYADANGGEVFHYRDSSGLECDAVVHLRNGSYGLIEIKLGGDRLIEEGVASLGRLAGKIDTIRMKKPSFLMVLTATGEYAYRRKDGVLVVPIGSLRE